MSSSALVRVSNAYQHVLRAGAGFLTLVRVFNAYQCVLTPTIYFKRTICPLILLSASGVIPK